MGDVKTKDITGFGTVANAVASVANNVINKISYAVGVIYNDSTYKMKKESLRKVYEEIANNENIDSFSKMAIISNLKQDLKYYKNQRTIISKAINNISDDANVNLVDDDWLNFFFDKARIISSEEMQNIWGKILSEEFNKPRSIPKSLLHTISCIDLELANIFNKLCCFTVKYEESGENCIFLDYNNFTDQLNAIGITFNALLALERFGLISFNSTIGYCVIIDSGNCTFLSQKNKFILKPDKKGQIPIGSVLLTNDGKVLCDCIQKEYNPLIFEMIKSICKDNIEEIIENGT